MLVNNININTFKAKLLKTDIQAPNIIDNSEWIEAALTPTYITSIYKYKAVKLTILFKADNKNELLQHVNKFIYLFKDAVTLTLDGYTNKFLCKLTGSNINKAGSVKNCTIDLNLNAIEYSDEKSVSITTKTHTINYAGLEDTPAILEFTSTVDQIDAIITGLTDTPITIRNIRANQTITIDGDTGLIVAQGVSKFNDVDIWQLPKLKPLNNNITINKDNITLVVKYKERY